MRAPMWLRIALFLVAAMASASVAHAAGVAALEQPAPAGVGAYRAPAAHAQPRRVGGSARALAPRLPAIVVLAPDHLGLTHSEQPTLYWFISEPTAARIELTLTEPGVEAPLLETVLPVAAAGIQSIDLRALGIRLERGIEYEWSVALVTDPAQRSRDIVSGGAIMRIESVPLDGEDVAALAERGLWYDLLMALDRRTHRYPQDSGPRGQLAAVLEQAGLGDVAEFERRR